jgi:hypothetical protein
MFKAVNNSSNHFPKTDANKVGQSILMEMYTVLPLAVKYNRLCK